MRILLTGGSGQLGWELRRTLAPRGEVVAPGRDALDLREPDRIRDVVRELSPDLVVNAAAFTDVDRAETEPEAARRVNADAPGVLAAEAGAAGAGLVHFSTDYVVAGEKEDAYRESDEPHPVNVYGETKLAGERAILDADVPALVLRLSWVYGCRRKNFVTTMLRLFRERDEVEVVGDQRGSPTWCRTAAEVTAQVLAAALAAGRDPGKPARALRERGGLYHAAARGSVSRYEQARAIQRHARRLRPDAGFDACRLREIPSAEYPAEAPRPPTTPLSSDRLEETFGLRLPDWEYDLVRCLEDCLPDV